MTSSKPHKDSKFKEKKPKSQAPLLDPEWDTLEFLQNREIRFPDFTEVYPNDVYTVYGED